MHAVHTAFRRIQSPVLTCVYRACLAPQTNVILNYNNHITTSAGAFAVGDSTRTGSLDLFDRLSFDFNKLHVLALCIPQAQVQHVVNTESSGLLQTTQKSPP